jgi:hypothetical protein
MRAEQRSYEPIPPESVAKLDRQLEQAIHEHYDRSGYWATSTSRRRPQNEVRPAGPDVVDVGERERPPTFDSGRWSSDGDTLGVVRRSAVQCASLGQPLEQQVEVHQAGIRAPSSDGALHTSVIHRPRTPEPPGQPLLSGHIVTRDHVEAAQTSEQHVFGCPAADAT